MISLFEFKLARELSQTAVSVGTDTNRKPAKTIEARNLIMPVPVPAATCSNVPPTGFKSGE